MNLILRLLRLDVAGINKTDLAIFSSRERMKRVIPKPSLTACTSLPVSLIFKSSRQMKDGYGSVSQSVLTGLVRIGFISIWLSVFHLSHAPVTLTISTIIIVQGAI